MVHPRRGKPFYRRPHLRHRPAAGAGVLLAIVVVGALAWSGSLYLELNPQGPSSRAAQVAVIDGDTIRIRTPAGSLERVRLLGIDAPERGRLGNPGQCYAQRASAALSALLPPGAQLTLVREPGQPDRDRYGRLLRYVEVGSIDLSAALLRQGAAEAATSRMLAARANNYQQAQRRAQNQAAGLWGACRR
jgi:micrococcal nuclease